MIGELALLIVNQPGSQPTQVAAKPDSKNKASYFNEKG